MPCQNPPVGRASLLACAVLSALSYLPLLLKAADYNEFVVYNYDHRNDGSLIDGTDVPGRLFVPQQAMDNPTQKYPIVLFFHGNGQRGSDNTSQVNGNIDNLLAKAKTEGFFIYAPQLTDKLTYWTTAIMDKVIRKLASAGHDYNVDVSKVYVTGLSLGGGGVWDSINRYGGGVAAAVSICGTNPNVALNFTTLVNRHIWSFHAKDDPGAPNGVNVSYSRNRVNGIRNADSLTALTWPPTYTSGVYFYDYHNQRYTEFETGGHGIWNNVYADPTLYSWMLDKSLPLATASLLVGETMYFDLGGTKTVIDASNNAWNSTSATQFDTLEAMLPFCLTSTGRTTPISLCTLQKFGSQGTGVSNAAYGPGIGTDGWQTAANGTGMLLIQGLIPGATYTLTIFGSSTSSNRFTRYEVGDAGGVQTQDLNATSNAANTVTFPAVADADGMLDISVRAKPGTSSTIGIVNAIELTR